MNSLPAYIRGPLDPEIERVLGAFDLDYVVGVSRRLAAIGTYERGFRPAGSRACAEAARMLEQEVRAIGLTPEVNRFSLTGWEFAGAHVEADGERIEAVAYGGAAGTAPDYEQMNWSRIVALEAQHRGAAAVICYPVNSFAQAEGALHSHDGQAVPDLVMVNISRRDGERLMAGTQKLARVVSSARVIPGAEGRNIVFTVQGADFPDEEIIIGDHYDAWFHGFLDDAVGVAAVLGLAKAVVDSGCRPRRALRFVLHDAEEYGAVDSPWDWCAGAWAQIARIRPEWQEHAVAAVIFELCGFKEAQEYVWFVSPDMAGAAERAISRLAIDALYPAGRRIVPQVTAWEDSFSYTACGVPTAANLELPAAMMERYYHTQYDTEEIFDPARYAAHVAGLGLLALTLDRQDRFEPDLGFRARQMRESLGALPAPVVRRLLDELERAAVTAHPPGEGARRATAVLNRRLTWLGGDGADETVAPVAQAGAGRPPRAARPGAVQPGPGAAARRERPAGGHCTCIVMNSYIGIICANCICRHPVIWSGVYALFLLAGVLARLGTDMGARAAGARPGRVLLKHVLPHLDPGCRLLLFNHLLQPGG